MNKYKLKISPAFNARPEIIPLQPLDEMNFDNEFESEGIVFDNQEYSLKVINEKNEVTVWLESVFILMEFYILHQAFQFS